MASKALMQNARAIYDVVKNGNTVYFGKTKVQNLEELKVEFQKQLSEKEIKMIYKEE